MELALTLGFVTILSFFCSRVLIVSNPHLQGFYEWCDVLVMIFIFGILNISNFNPFYSPYLISCIGICFMHDIFIRPMNDIKRFLFIWLWLVQDEIFLRYELANVYPCFFPDLSYSTFDSGFVLVNLSLWKAIVCILEVCDKEHFVKWLVQNYCSINRNFQDVATEPGKSVIKVACWWVSQERTVSENHLCKLFQFTSRGLFSCFNYCSICCVKVGVEPMCVLDMEKYSICSLLCFRKIENKSA